MKKIDNETKEIIDSFVSEGYDLLEQAESKITNIEGENQNDVINTIFRLFHSIKGSAGYLNFNNIKQVTHEAENLLDIFRKKGKSPSSNEIDIIYQAMDFLRQLIWSVEKELSDEGFEKASEIFVRDLKECIQSVEKDFKDLPDQDIYQSNMNLLDTIVAQKESGTDIIIEELVIEEKKDSNQPIDSLDDLITPKMVEGFVTESIELIEKSENAVLLLEKNTEDKELVGEIFRNIHTLKGNAGFFAFHNLEREAMLLETVLDEIRKNQRYLHPNMITVILDHMDFMIHEIHRIKDENEDKAGKNSSKKTSEIFFHPCQSKNDEIKIETINEDVNKRKREKKYSETNKPDFATKYKQIGEILIDMGATSQENIDKALELQSKPLGQILVETGIISEDKLEKALEMQKKNTSESMATMQMGRKEIRVDTSKLDKLFDLVGELIIAQSMVGNSPDIKGLKLDNFNKAFNLLGKVTRELQEVSMMVRMIPLEGLFNKMTRLVRDLSKKFNKKVNLEITGQETEMDRTLMEQISDPLVHIIRNALDHGLEDPKTRVNTGKDETGLIKLNAKYEGNEIWIIVRDDGKGLSRNKILSKAIEKRLIEPETENKMRDEDVWQLIFEPGFSTADKLTEVSGRGVGMDVVKKNLEKLKGKIDIKTQEGIFTEFILRIPLTMAIIDGITVKVGEHHYSIPITDIIEFFKIKKEQIVETESGNQVIQLRKEIFPIVKLYEVFNITTGKIDLTEGIMILIHSDENRACLYIDEIIGNQQLVIKALPEYMGKVEGLSGCSVMGDGGVSFIIDTGGLLSKWME